MKLKQQILFGTVATYLVLTILLLLIGAKSLEATRNKLLYNPPLSVEEIEFSELKDQTFMQADMVEAELDHFYKDVNFLRDFFEKQLHDSSEAFSVGWPKYGYVHPVYGAYADFDLSGEGSPWLPKRVVDRASQDLEYKKLIFENLDDVMAMTPIFSSIYTKYQSDYTVDLVWVVLDNGVSNVYPPYDYLSIISKNPDVIDNNESENDYVRLVNPENDPERQAMWLKPYFDDYRSTWMVSIVAPLYDSDQFLGSIGMDILLPSIISKVGDSTIAGSNYLLLLDRDGYPVAMSETAINNLILDEGSKQAFLESLKPVADQHWTPEMKDSFRQPLEKIIGDPLLSLIKGMANQDHGVVKIGSKNELKVISFVTIPEIGWKIVTVLPYEIVTGLVLDYGVVVSAMVDQLVNYFWVLLLFGFIFISMISFLGYRAFVDPIVDLMREVKRLSLKRDEAIRVDPALLNRKDEIGLLAMTIKNAAKELKDSEDKYSSLVEKSNDGIVVLRDNKILFANNRMAKMLGHRVDDCLGKDFSHCIVSRDRKEIFKSNITTMKAAGAGSRFECNLLDANKGEVPVEINSSRVVYENQPAVLMMVRDMTRYKETEKLRNDFASIASHQMRTPLTGIKWFVELLLNGKAGRLTIKQKDYLEQVQVSNEKMITLIDDMLSVSRIESVDKFKVLLKSQDIVKVFHLAIENAQEAANKKKITIRHRKKCIERFVAEFDKEKLLMVLQNILDNAIKYSPDNGNIFVETSVNKGWITISIADQGAGIPLKQQGHVFQRFFRAENTANTHPGTGLGLYIAKFLIEKQNGKIWFESVEGQGSTFYISLPVKVK